MPLSAEPDYKRAYHLGQYENPYGSTKALAAFLRKYVLPPEPADSKNDVIQDVGCGAGATIHWLDKWNLTPRCTVRGIDGDPELLAIARALQPGREWACADFMQPLKWSADISLSVQVLSFIEDWRGALKVLIESSRRSVIVSSLFWDGVETHTHATDDEKKGVHYNIIDVGAFQDECKRLGAVGVTWKDFEALEEIHGFQERLRSRTVGSMTFSGPIYLPWRFAMVTL